MSSGRTVADLVALWRRCATVAPTCDRETGYAAGRSVGREAEQSESESDGDRGEGKYEDGGSLTLS